MLGQIFCIGFQADSLLLDVIVFVDQILQFMATLSNLTLPVYPPKRPKIIIIVSIHFNIEYWHKKLGALVFNVLLVPGANNITFIT